MASLGGVLGGIAASPFRLAGGMTKGAVKLGYGGLKATAIAAADVSGALPFFAAAAGITKGVKKGITAGYSVGKKLLRPVGEGTVAEDSAIKAIAAAASETAKIQAETAKIEAETEALTGEKKAEKDEVVAKTTMGGVDVEILEKIYGEVVSIRGIIGDKDPESEKKELALDEQTRHKKFLKALAAIGLGGKGDKEKKPWLDLGSLTDMFKGFLPTILAGLGLAGLIAMWPKISSAFESIGDAISNINEFLDDMAAFFKPLTDILGGADPTTLAAAAGAAKGVGSQSKSMAKKRLAMREAKKESKRLKAEQDKARKAKLKADEKARKARLAEQKKRLKADAEKANKAEKARLKKLADAEKARLKNQRTVQSQKTGQKVNVRTTATRGLPGAKTGSGRGAGSTRTTQTRFATGGKKVTTKTDPRARRGGQALRTGSTLTRFATGGRVPIADTGDPRARRGGPQLRTGTTLTRFTTGGRVPVVDQGRRGAGDTQRTARGGPGRWLARLAASRMFQGGVQGALPEGVRVPGVKAPVYDQGRRGAGDTQRTARGGPGRWLARMAVGRMFQGGVQGALPEGVKVPGAKLPGGGRPSGGRQFIRSTGPTLAGLLDDAGKGTGSTKPQKIPGWKAAVSTKPFVNPVTQNPMSSRYYYRPETGRWHDIANKNQMVKGVTVTEYMKKMGFEFKPDKANFKLTAAQRAFMGEKPNFVNRMQGSMKWMGKAAGPLAVVFIGYAIKNMYDKWAADPETIETKDKWPFNDSTAADKTFKLDMAALAAAFGVGWVTAILGGMLGTTIGGPIGGFLGGLAFGIAGGLAADKITRWLMGEEVEKKGTVKPMGGRSGIAKTESQQLESKIANMKGRIKGDGSSKPMGGRGRAYKKTDSNLSKEQMGTMVEKWEADLVRVKAEEAAGAERLEHGDVGASMGLDKVLPAPAIQDTFDLDVKREDSSSTDAAAIDALTDEQAGAMSLVGASHSNIKAGESSSTSYESIQPNPESIGTTLTALGKNGGQPSADIVITNINNTTNSDHQQVSSTASTSNIITFDKAPSYSPMRSRFAV